jgi:hypothetical protein
LPDSSPPAASPVRPPYKRPVYLVIALLLVWVLGLCGTVQSCQTIEDLRQPGAARAALSKISNAQAMKQREIYIDTSLQFRNIVTPLAVGQLLLASLLTLTAGLTLVGRGQARRLALQAMVAYAIFLPLDYVTRGPVRAVIIDALAQSMPLLTFNGADVPPELSDPRVIHQYAQWAFRVGLGAQLVIVALGLFALTRPRVRAFFGAMAERTRE